MSNHAYVVPKKMPTSRQINKDAQEICARKFPQFVLNYDGKKNWHLKYDPAPSYLGLIFWRSKTGDPRTWNQKLEKCTVELPCIEFRHGHSWPFLWWVEYEIREELAVRYDAKVMDDSDGKLGRSQKERFATYSEYMAFTRSEMITDQTMLNYVNYEIQMCRTGVPKDLLPLIGETISVELLNQKTSPPSRKKRGPKTITPNTRKTL